MVLTHVIDIAERLRRAAGGRVPGEPSVMHEAADEIERLRAENKRYARTLDAMDQKLHTLVNEVRMFSSRPYA